MPRSASARSATADQSFLLSALSLTGIVLLWLLSLAPITLWVGATALWDALRQRS